MHKDYIGYSCSKHLTHCLKKKKQKREMRKQALYRYIYIANVQNFTFIRCKILLIPVTLCDFHCVVVLRCNSAWYWPDRHDTQTNNI